MYCCDKSSQNGDVPNNVPNNVPMMWWMLLFATSLTSYNVDNHQDVADYPQAPAVLGVHESESEQRFAARDEEGVQEEINAEQFDVAVDDEWSSDITQINHHLQSIIQQLRQKEDKINELERRIKDIEHWKTTRLSTSWPLCTSIGGENFVLTDSVSQGQVLAGENEDSQGFNGGADKQKKQLTRRRGRNPHLESTAQPPTKRKRALAPIMMKESHHITEMISSTVPEEPMNRILLLIMPVQDSQTVT